MFGTYNKGFTLLELVAAILIFTVSFTVFFSLLNTAITVQGAAKKDWDKFLVLDSSYKLGNYTTLQVEKIQYDKYKIPVIIYRYRDLYFVELE